MALCTSPIYDSTICNQYPSNKGFICEKFLGGKYVYTPNKYGRIIQEDFDKNITNVLSYLELPYDHVQNTLCSNYLLLLICHYIYPLCIPNDKTKLWNKKQNLCSESCSFYQNELCVGVADDIAKLAAVNYINDDYLGRYINGLISIVKNDCSNDDIFDTNHHSSKTDCFFLKGMF